MTPTPNVPTRPPSVAELYAQYDIRDERAVCGCGRSTVRTFNGQCYTCHVRLYLALGQVPCPGLPVSEPKAQMQIRFPFPGLNSQP